MNLAGGIWIEFKLMLEQSLTQRIFNESFMYVDYVLP